MRVENCRFCAARLTETVADLGEQPPANSYLRHADLDRPESVFPLVVMRCEECGLVQLGYVVPPNDIFEEYAYFSSYSTSWVEHARRFAESSRDRFDLDGNSLVVEVGSNDGYLLQHFHEMGIETLGIDPAANVVETARERGVPTHVAFFSEEVAGDLADEGSSADLIIGNNVYAHVPDINGFTAGLRRLLKPDGTISLEFPHLVRLLELTQFDTIYHEHYSYLSLSVVERIMAAHGLRVFAVEELATHGGSIRVSACRAESSRFPEEASVARIRALESDFGLDRSETYAHFAAKLPGIKRAFVDFVKAAREDGKTIAAYSAPAKGNTFLNYCRVGADDIALVADLNPAKQNHFLPGSRIPITSPDKLFELKPAYVLILAWNLRDEISRQLNHVAEWGGKFVVGIPTTEVLAG